jgi:membrane protease YdiL (CAAX protease family)
VAEDAFARRTCDTETMTLRWGRYAVAYAVLGVAAAVMAIIWRDGTPLVHPHAWLVLESRVSHTYSLLLGAAFAALVVVSTRPLVTRFAWARNLHRELRPFAASISTTGIVVLALLSAFGEELVFRGLLQPWLGLFPQALLFGLVHYLPGSSRWVWAAWAMLVGLALGAIFQLTGSLVGPLVAHALINGVNLMYLKRHDPAPQRRLGGLLGQRS